MYYSSNLQLAPLSYIKWIYKLLLLYNAYFIEKFGHYLEINDQKRHLVNVCKLCLFNFNSELKRNLIESGKYTFSTSGKDLF